jgi:MFS family permease
VALGTAIFAAPFILFSMIAGRLADRIGKPRLIVATKIWELGMVAAAVASLWFHSIPLMMLCLFILSTQATFFSPAKYGILPEMMTEGELPSANAWLNIGTFTAILIGTLAGSHLALHWTRAAGLMVVAAVIGLAASLLIQSLPPAKSDSPIPLNPFADLVANWKLIRTDRALYLSVLAVNYFWFMGAALQTNIFLYTKEMIQASPEVSGYLIVAIAIGVGVGSYLAARLSQGKVELGLVPLGTLGMSFFALDLLGAYHSRPRVFVDLFMLGASGGFYDISADSMAQSFDGSRKDYGHCEFSQLCGHCVGGWRALGLGDSFKTEPSTGLFCTRHSVASWDGNNLSLSAGCNVASDLLCPHQHDISH